MSVVSFRPSKKATEVITTYKKEQHIKRDSPAVNGLLELIPTLQQKIIQLEQSNVSTPSILTPSLPSKSKIYVICEETDELVTDDYCLSCHLFCSTNEKLQKLIKKSLKAPRPMTP